MSKPIKKTPAAVRGARVAAVNPRTLAVTLTVGQLEELVARATTRGQVQAMERIDQLLDRLEARGGARERPAAAAAASRFSAWMRQTGRTQTDIARELDLDASMLSRLCAGHRLPGRDAAARIERLTGGAVRATDWSAA